MRALATGGLLAGWRGFAFLACLSLAVLALGGVARGSSSTGLLKVRLGGDQIETRIVLDLDRSVTGKLLQDGSDGKIVVSLPRIDTASNLSGGGQGLVRRWNIERGATAVKLNIELARGAQVHRRFLLPPGDGVSTYRYVIDLKALGEAPTATPAVRSAPPVPVIAARATIRGGPRIVVIDPGHGGKDPGAPGASAHEKDITLAAAKALKARLERTGRYRVVLTRSSDDYIPLESRVRIARAADADLFISLHADSGPTTSMRGASVYTLSERGESRVTKVLRKDDWLMPVSFPGADRTVGEIILDLTQRSTRNRSAEFAGLLLDHIADETPLLRRSHRDGNLMVLLAPDVPAVLLEMGFINNPDDERQLTNSASRKRLMDAVGDAVDDWFARQAKTATS
jgi:N-acetylmuramoyl-L-alanine amidase